MHWKMRVTFTLILYVDRPITFEASAAQLS